MNLEGNLMMPQLAKDLDFAFKMNGSLVVCMSEEDCRSCARCMKTA